MHGKYKIVFILLFITMFAFSKESKKSIVFFATNKEKLSKNALLSVKYLVDVAKKTLLSQDECIALSNIDDEINFMDIKKIESFIYSRGIQGFYHLDVTQNAEQVNFKLKLYNYDGDILLETVFEYLLDFKTGKYLSKKKEKDWSTIITESGKKDFKDEAKENF